MSQLRKIAAPTGTPRGTAIFVHGLGGDAFGTWRARPGEEALWPRWLAEDIPGLAVFSVGYPAAVSNWQGTSMPLQDRAGNVLEGLLVEIEHLHAPIVFVCHSLGGLVVKQLLRKANDMQQGRPEAVELLRRVRGVAFMATPHTGSQLANVLGLFKTVFRVSSATQNLIRNDPALRDLNTWYRDWSQGCSIKHRVFFETITLHGVTTVDPGSADPGLSNAQPIAIDADHLQICKPESREVLIYKSTRDFISKIVQSPPTTSDPGISAPLQQKRVAMMAPKPPADFVQRPLEFEALKKKLLYAKGDAVALTAALRGAGGYGKTTLAKALAHDPDIQVAYSDGILWAELGEKPKNVLSIISDLITRLTDAPPGLETIDAAASALGEALGDRHILMIVDDAWREQDLRAFLHGGPNTTRLVTTRIDNILPADTGRQPVDRMQDQEALNLLVWGLPADQTAAWIRELGNLVARLGEWPLLLKIVNGFLRDRVLRSRQPMAHAIVGVNKRLDDKGLVAFDARSETDRSKAVARTMGVSLDLLDGSARARFGEIGIFPEDVDVPIGIVGRFWAETGSIDELETEDLLSEFHGLSLLLDFDLDRRTFRLHDTVRNFLQDQAGRERLFVQQKGLVRALEGIHGSDQADALTRLYFYLYFLYHLAEVKDRSALDALLLDPAWLIAKLAATGDTHALVTDYDQHAVGEAQNLIGQTLRLTAGLCARDQRQLIPQLLGRLSASKSIAATGFLDAARAQLLAPAILTKSLNPPGVENARLEGLTNSCHICLLPDGRLASGSSPIGLWDVKTGLETGRLEGHSTSATTLCVLPDGRLASGYDDKTIRLWDVSTGAETNCLDGHLESVLAMCVLSDGRLASGSDDNTIRLWNAKTGIETALLEGHSNRVTSLCVLADGRLVSGSYDNTIRLWDVKTGSEITRLQIECSDWIYALCALPDGRVAVGCYDNTIRLWDVETGAETTRLSGHSAYVGALCVLPDGRLASGSDDNTIRLWDVKTGAETALLEGNLGAVGALCVLPDGRLASVAIDGVIRLWDVSISAHANRRYGHSARVTSLCLLPDGRLASASWDKTIRLWDVSTGTETARLEGHSDRVTSLCLLPDGRLASGSLDETIRLWDVNACAEAARLEEAAGKYGALCVLPDGRLASAYPVDEKLAVGECLIRLLDVKTGAESARLAGADLGSAVSLCMLNDGRLASGHYEKPILIWDVKTGAKTARLEVPSSLPCSLCALSDGRLASCSEQGVIRLWDVHSGAETRLEGHLNGVFAMCLLPGGHLASGSWDKMIRLWDVSALREIASLQVDAEVTCLAALPDGRLVAGDGLGQLHWLEIVN